MNLENPITWMGMIVVLALIYVLDKALEGAISGTVKAIFSGWLNWLVILIVIALIVLANGGF